MDSGEQINNRAAGNDSKIKVFTDGQGVSFEKFMDINISSIIRANRLATPALAWAMRLECCQCGTLPRGKMFRSFMRKPAKAMPRSARVRY